MNRKITINELKDRNSKYFCGTAALISLSNTIKLFHACEKEIKEKTKKIEQLCENLSIKDSVLYSYSCRKELIIEEEWDMIIEIYADYVSLFENLRRLEIVLSESQYSQFLRPIIIHHNFLISTVRMCGDIFFERTDVPFKFARYIKDLLVLDPIEVSEKKTSIDSKSEDILLNSSYPLTAMLYKLIDRKENGKGPFTIEFGYKNVMDRLTLLLKKTEFKDLNELIDISNTAMQYVKMKSLKEDFIYISDYFSALKSLK